MIDLAACQALDAADPLASSRRGFDLPDGVVYLDGNSLGPLPSHVPDRIERAVRQGWGEGLIRSWNTEGWVDLPYRAGDRIAQVIGREPGTVVVCDSTSVNLFKTVSAALEMTDRKVVLSDSGNFPTDLYVMSSLAELRIVEPDDVIESITDEIGVVALTQVGYATGRMHDMPSVTRTAHDARALMVWDLAHSAGAMPIELGDADFAVGCGYKYLNGGPGAPAFLYVRPDHLPAFRNPITGWFGHAAPFDFSLDFVPAEGITRARVGTPHVLSLVALDAALEVFDDIDLDLIREKSVSLTETFIQLVDQTGLPLELVSPRDASVRGSQVCLRHPDGYAIVQTLIDRGVIGDFRSPDVLRFGFAPLYISHVDVFEAARLLTEVMETGAYRHPKYAARNKVT